MKLKYFEDDIQHNLITDISKNNEFYIKIEKANVLETYFKDKIKTSDVVVDDINLIFTPNAKLSTIEKNNQDMENTKILYSGYKILTPLQASTREMWSYLCHFDFREYVISRWIKNPEDEDKNEDLLKTIKKRFFVEDTKSLLRMNAISRLWWAGYLTYDESNQEDKFHLTKILFAGQQIAGDILDTPFRGNKDIIMGILFAVKKYSEDRKAVVPSDKFRECIRYLRRYAAVTALDCLSPNQVSDITLQFLYNN